MKAKTIMTTNQPSKVSAKDVVILISSFEELGSPFKKDLTGLFTKYIMNEEVVWTVRTARQLGEQQFRSFFKET